MHRYIPSGFHSLVFSGINVVQREGLPARVVVHFDGDDLVYVKNLDRPATSETFRHLAAALGLDPDLAVQDGVPVPSKWLAARGRHVQVHAEQRMGGRGFLYLAVRWYSPDDEGPCSYRPAAAGGAR